MEDNKLTQEMKSHAVIVAIHAKHIDLGISRFFNVARSFIHKVRRGLEASDGKVESVSKYININLVQTQLEHQSLCNKSRPLLIKSLQSHKGNIGRSSSFCVHNPSHCP